jgi:hypothetical protein
MSARLRPRLPERYSKEARRSETAALYHDLTKGVVKMIAAERGVSISRVYRMGEGLDANPIELLVADLDRIEREGEGHRIAALVAYLEARYGVAEGAGDGVEDELAAFERTHGDGVATLLQLMKDGVDEGDLAKVAEVVGRLKRDAEAIKREWKATVEAKKFKRPKTA